MSPAHGEISGPRWAAYAATRLTELILIVIGAGSTVLADRASAEP
jgi:hypothetical protein